MKNSQQILTVSQLNEQLKYIVEDNFPAVIVAGEISNFKPHSHSGHFYFTLKDEKSQIRSVMWKSRNSYLSFNPEDGMKVIATGRITVYPPKGEYQFEIWEMKPHGIGELQLKFEDLKRKLFEEGLFDESHKKPIPTFPQNVAIITSKTGAVLQDFINIIKRRFPILTIYLYPVIVQGPKASEDVINALLNVQELSKQGHINKIDTIVIARGGGSIEDLWPFNDEKLARTIYHCTIPIVSAIGHEIDYTICDFVADRRAPTPSTAAEIITPDIKELLEKLNNYEYLYKVQINKKLKFLLSSINEIENSYYFKRPKDLIYNFFQSIDIISKDIIETTTAKISQLHQHIDAFKNTLFHINPDLILRKGYALIYKLKSASEKNMQILISRASQLNKHDDIDIKFHDNHRFAKITK